MYFIVYFGRKYFLSLRGRKSEAIQSLPILNGRKFRNPNWTKMDFWGTLFSNIPPQRGRLGGVQYKIIPPLTPPTGGECP